ncbi:uncharacterized protein LOC104879577 [Vitis vinifera]|uniref:uncharacterized protein LOC104879577 n=1 Tax=Vitis vinifera TaxID=29760 RepID=UPI00053F4ECD|nr:uncharacterized protein LOC104879577 [Vitis vinifera]|eukprot:XP_010651198.1 PREDICTED: uncharacterized protein LOC104879577 [Vitis vinifera]
MGGEGQDQKELGQRTWNLRPRTAVRKHFNAIRGQSGISNPICNILETTKKQEKPKKFLITLTWEEIEADFLAMTGSKPPRKPKRRPKNVQNVIDNLAPGLWLHEVNPSSYECKGSKSHN